ncbi:MAG: hypothetical protein KDA31_06635 [Phycisphaerales bacterium]|nr:hypothetical protein [Phycisphaerales bacterium]MCB9836119.1 hypothetical protein [Phycisphaera sp.]
MNGIELLDYSIAHPEPLLDPAYERHAIIISDSEPNSNLLVQANQQVISLINKYGEARNNSHRDEQADIVEKLLELLISTKHINFTEFVSFWPTLDFSYSQFCDCSRDNQIYLLTTAITKYLDKRHTRYQLHGYSATTLQAISDSYSHKSMGQLATHKITDLCTKSQLKQRLTFQTDPTLDSMEFAIIGGKNANKSLRKYLRHNDVASKNYRRRMPDFVFSINNHIYVGEHKHCKEEGSGQYNQIAQLERFISQNKPAGIAHYIAFMDGVLFNRLMNPTASRKLRDYQNDIRKALTEIPTNYFVNTAGFKELLSRLTS